MMPNNLEREFAPSEHIPAEEVVSDPVDNETDSPILERYVRHLDETLATELTRDAVQERLNRLMRGMAAQSKWHDRDLDGLCDDLARYANQVVWVWLMVIALDEDRTARFDTAPLALAEHDADEITEDVVARAGASFREDVERVRWWLRDESPEMHTIFLLECALQLPGAYRSWLASTGRVPWEEQHVNNGDLLRSLYGHMRDDSQKVAYLLESSRYTREEVSEIVRVTLEVFEFAAREWADDGGDGR
jgi:hypothetical protein